MSSDEVEEVSSSQGQAKRKKTQVMENIVERAFSHLKEVKDDKQNRQETPTTDAILKAKFWMLNEEKPASKIKFPKELVILAKNV
jgi:hypothetical protein